MKDLQPENSQSQVAPAETPGNMEFAEIPKLPEKWWEHPSIVWSVWNRDTYYLWGANADNYQQGPIGTWIGGGGMAGPKGPTRGRYQPNYIGVITMGLSEMGKNDAVFQDLDDWVASGNNVMVPVYNDSHAHPPEYKFSLGTGIGANQPDWAGIQKYILEHIYGLGRTCGKVEIPAGVYWPDLSKSPATDYPIKKLEDIKYILDKVLS